jgi:NAD(P)-dependent dehydrogenase (short-subunit alcohol dehydrogenase family)
MRVAVFDRDAERGQDLCAQLPGSLFARVDVSDEASVAAGLAAVQQAFGGLDVCVSCAGINVGIKTLSDEGPHPLADFQRVIGINLVGTFNVLRLAAEQMAKNEPDENGERGVIVNTASVAAYEAQIGQVAYGASKGGIVGMTLPVARDLAKLGIRCNTIAPGLMNTPLFEKIPQKVVDRLVEMIQFPPRLGEPSEFALLARHIVENPYLNGETIRLDAGIRMQAR